MSWCSSTRAHHRRDAPSEVDQSPIADPDPLDHTEEASHPGRWRAHTPEQLLEAPEDGSREVDMGRYVILLILPVIAGVLIAAGAILVSALRQHRIDVRRTLLEARRPNPALSLADAAAGEVSSELPHRRIAS